MTQWWRNLLFAHWPVNPAAIQKLLPPQLQVDVMDGMAWVAVVPFYMTGVRPRGLPALWDFAELNVRTYVRPAHQPAAAPGVYFWSLEANSPMAVWGARSFFHLPYMHAKMSCQTQEHAVQYRSERTHRNEPPASFQASYQGGARADKSSLTDFLTERYCLYTTDAEGALYRGDIHHAPWPLEEATASIEINTMASAAGIELPSQPPLLHYAHALEVAIWPLRKIA